MLDPLLPSLASDFGVTVAGAAPVLAGFSIAYGAGQLVIGPLGDRYGKLRVAWFALLLYGFGLAACTLALLSGDRGRGQRRRGLARFALAPPLPHPRCYLTLLSGPLGQLRPWRRRA